MLSSFELCFRGWLEVRPPPTDDGCLGVRLDGDGAGWPIMDVDERTGSDFHSFFGRFTRNARFCSFRRREAGFDVVFVYRYFLIISGPLVN